MITAPQPAEQHVTTQGQAPVATSLQAARASAIAEAQRAATDLVLGALITAETQVANYTLVRDTVVRRSGGLARLISVNSESQKDGIYTVNATFAVATTPLADQIRSLLDRTGDPRILLVIPETLNGSVLAASTAESVLATSLIDRGFRVLDLSQSERNALRSQALTEPKMAQAAAQRFGADLIISGTAASEANTAVPEAIRTAGLLSFTAKLNIKVVDAVTAQQLFNQVFSAPGIGVSNQAAIQVAQQRAAEQAVAPASARLIDWLAGSGTTARRTFTLQINGFPNYRTYSAWLQDVRVNPQLTTVTSRDFDAAGTVIQVEFSGSADALADLLEGFKLTVTGVTGAEIRAAYRP